MAVAFEEPPEHPQRAGEELRLRRLLRAANLKNRIQHPGFREKPQAHALNPESWILNPALPTLAALFLRPV